MVNKKKINSLIVIPAHNEEETIYEVVTRSLEYADVSVTDDGSRDKTPIILKKIQTECSKKKYKHSLNVITHSVATHIPLGLQDGLKYGVSKKYDFIITMDAGLSHNPDELPDFLNQDSAIDIVIGSRKIITNVPFYRKLISFLAARVVNYTLTSSYLNIFGPGIKDCTSGYRRYSFKAAKIISESDLKSKSFDFHMEALALGIRRGMTFKETSISYVFSNSSFNKNVLKQALKFALYLIGTKNLKQSSGSMI